MRIVLSILVDLDDWIEIREYYITHERSYAHSAHLFAGSGALCASSMLYALRWKCVRRCALSRASM